MTGRIQEAGKGDAIHRQTRVLTRGACCDQLVAIHIQTHMRTHIFFYFFFISRGNPHRYPPPRGEREGYAGLLPAKTSAGVLHRGVTGEPRVRHRHSSATPPPQSLVVAGREDTRPPPGSVQWGSVPVGDLPAPQRGPLAAAPERGLFLCRGGGKGGGPPRRAIGGPHSPRTSLSLPPIRQACSEGGSGSQQGLSPI